MNCLRPMLLMMAVMLTACGAPVAMIDYYGADTPSLQRFARMEILAEADLSSGQFEKVGTVTGIYCKKGVAQTHSDSRVEAIDQVKLKAAQRGATHISTPACTFSGLDMANNCFEKIVCKAAALQAQ